MQKIQPLKLKKNKYYTILTGAGISAESGVPTFRGNGGLWEDRRVEEVATPEAFNADPESVWRFYKMRYQKAAAVKPNNGHKALAVMQKSLTELNGDDLHFNLITQNIDNLHARAGSTNVLEMHGSLFRARCTNCTRYARMDKIDLKVKIPTCPDCGSALRPDVVWFGEMPYFMDEIFNILQKTYLLIVVGTSGAVYPAAQFAQIVKMAGGRVMGVNLEKPANVAFFDDFYQGKAGTILPDLLFHKEK